ncbi:MAG: hypothetical protein H5T86_07805, partial [Armatimonadetes bacterium]|nr:hypothetical protein [Armatimonadota bacterium]
LLALISDLRLAPDQVAALVQLVAQIGNDVDAANADRKALAERARELMPAVEAALRQGKPLEADMADKVQQILAEDDQTIGELKRAMADYLRRMARMLRPEQQRLVNWTPPGDVLRLIPAEFAAMRLRQRAAIIRRGLDFLNYLKYRTAKDYMNLKVSQSREFVAAFVDPRSPAYARALEMTLDLVSEARMVAREEWEGGADVEYATHLMRAIGALRDPEAQEPTGQEIYTWQRLYDILTVPGVHQMFTEGGGH